MQKIVPHLWFDKEAGEAANLYMSLFDKSRLISKIRLENTPSGTAELLTIELAGQEFMLISAGPFFKFTPAISFIINCSSKSEVDKLWEKLIEDGTVLMPLGEYPFSEKYGWVSDRYGLSWQILYIGDSEIKQKIIPTLMFVGEQCGKTEEATNFYTGIFKNSGVKDITRYGADDAPDREGTIKHAQFKLENHRFAAMDSAHEHGFAFNEAVSFVVNCDTQQEIDYYWNKLSAVPEAEQCGWLKDKYGLSWQITPAIMKDMMEEDNQAKTVQVTDAFLKMKKFDIDELVEAYEK